MSDIITARIAESRRLLEERRSCLKTIEDGQWHDNYTDMARARDRIAAIDAIMLAERPALLDVVEAAQRLLADVDTLPLGSMPSIMDVAENARAALAAYARAGGAQ